MGVVEPAGVEEVPEPPLVLARPEVVGAPAGVEMLPDELVDSAEAAGEFGR